MADFNNLCWGKPTSISTDENSYHLCCSMPISSNMYACQPSCAGEHPQLIKRNHTQNTKIFPIKVLQLEPLVSDHVLSKWPAPPRLGVTDSGLSKVASCRQKSPPTWLVSASYSPWHFLNKISLDWLLTLTTQPSASKLSDNPADYILSVCKQPPDAYVLCYSEYAGCDSKILSCRIYAISRRGIIKQGSTFGPIFLLLPIRVARAHTHSSQGKSPARSS